MRRSAMLRVPAGRGGDPESSFIILAFKSSPHGHGGKFTFFLIQLHSIMAVAALLLLSLGEASPAEPSASADGALDALFGFVSGADLASGGGGAAPRPSPSHGPSDHHNKPQTWGRDGGAALDALFDSLAGMGGAGGADSAQHANAVDGSCVDVTSGGAWSARYTWHDDLASAAWSICINKNNNKTPRPPTP